MCVFWRSWLCACVFVFVCLFVFSCGFVFVFLCFLRFRAVSGLFQTSLDWPLLRTTPVLLCTTKYYSSTILYYKVLLRTTKYSFVLQSITPYCSTTLYYKVLLRTTKCYSSTIPYYSVLQSLLPYYSVLPSTTPCFSSTTKYYKILLHKYYADQCNPELQNTIRIRRPAQP